MTAAAYDAIVIGAGVNGLVTAGLLARNGRRTLVLERGSLPGGCAATEEPWPGYRVDTGAHEAGLLDRRIQRELGLDRSSLEIVELPGVAALTGDGEALVFRPDPGETAAAIRRFSPRDADRWPEFVASMERAARALGVLYEAPPPRIAGAGRRELAQLVGLGARLGRIGRAEAVELMRLLPMTIEELLGEWFESDAVAGALALLGCRGIFQGPMAAGTALVFLHGLVGGGRPRVARRVRGGMGALGTALADAARRAGAEIRFEAPVASVTVKDGRTEGVVLESGEEIRTGLVASSADPARTFLGLVDPLDLSPDFARQVRNIRYRGGLAKVHLAVEGLPDGPVGPGAAAAFCVAPDVRYTERAYDDAKYGRASGAPCLEGIVPTLVDPAMAPEGRHVVSLYVQYAPYRLAEGEWDADARAALGEAAVDALEAGLPGLAGRIVESQVLSPRDLSQRFALTEGNIQHGEMTLDQAFIGRPVAGWSRYATPIAGLWLCGAGAHPGGGLTGSPGVNAARAILRARLR